jgi:hypothetical protein
MSHTKGESLTNDNYPTPVCVVEALMAAIDLRPNDRFLEPCRGLNRVIYDRVQGTTLTKSWAELDEGVDYLTTPFAKQDVIITNPPFTLTEQFLRKSFSELADDGTLIYLQRVNYLGSIDRLDMWAELTYPPKHPIIVPRPKFVGKGSDSCEYIWMIWDRGGRCERIPTGFSAILSATGDSKKLQKYLESKREVTD